ncbi:MAG: SPOR domain-containing protein [Magnetococcales bacterium]|nr:SPOR domain-containing protein [Magnetococcales bacterium]MBF0114557.1 SPOR domain-containing protein [Magnetococcales bacterium]
MSTTRRNLFLWILFLSAVLSAALPAAQAAETGKAVTDATPRRFTLLVDPANAKVEILNLKTPYQPEMPLKPGRYHIAVSAPNFVTERGFVDVTDQDWIGKVVLLPMTTPAKGEENDESVAARIEEEWQKIKREKEQLGKNKQNLEREREKLDLAWKEVENAKTALEAQRKEWENSRKEAETKPLGSIPASENRLVPEKPQNGSPLKAVADKPNSEKAVTEKALAEQRTELPIPTPTPQAAPRKWSKEPALPVETPLPVPQPLAATHDPALQREGAATPAANANETPASNPEPAANLDAEHNTPATIPSAPSVAPTVTEKPVTEKSPTEKPVTEKPAMETSGVATAKSPEDKPQGALLNEAMRYLRLPRPPRSAAPPESEAVLLKLQQAQKEYPGNQAIAQAVQLHAKRYIAYVGLFEIKEKAEAMVSNIQALGVPAFLQAMTVKSKPVLRVCIGPFLQQNEAEKNLQFLLDKVEIKNPILRIYKQ